MPEFLYQDPFPQGKDDTKYRLLTKEYVSVSRFNGKEVLVIDPEGLAFLAHQAFRDVSYLLRPAHQEKVAAILSDPEASQRPGRRRRHASQRRGFRDTDQCPSDPEDIDG